MNPPRITLDQWSVLQAVVESGSYAKAAERLHRSQSTLSYAIRQVERLASVQVFSLQGRKAVLTSAGEALYRQGKKLVEEAHRVERLAAELAAGWESEIVLAVEIVFPTWLLLECLGQFAKERPQTRIELFESVLGGTEEALLQRQVDFAIGPLIPQGFLGDRLMPVRFVAAAHPDHPLHHVGRAVTIADLKEHRHLLVRETGSQRASAPSLFADERWIVSNKATSIRAACMGLGFAWFPEENIRDELREGQLKILPMREGGQRYGNLYLIFADPEAVRPGARRLAQIIQTTVKERCAPLFPAEGDDGGRPL
ncbi:MAG TPA: LysR family transcriptional regulator [Burkholderiaceae bacterium]|nr:LysR family transcriptional regulator [Burkholderiaceae bacterium]